MRGYEVISRNVECPTCLGTGYVPKDSKAEYVALIPLSDRRLRPRRTCLKISAAVFLCFLIFLLLLIFLFPRNISLSSDVKHIVPYESTFNSATYSIDLLLHNGLNIYNPNYVPVSVTEIMVTPKYRSFDLEPTVITTDTILGLRLTTFLNITTKIHFGNKEFGVVKLCMMNESYFHDIYITFTFQISTSMFWQKYDTYLTIMPLVDCHPQNLNKSISI